MPTGWLDRDELFRWQFGHRIVELRSALRHERCFLGDYLRPSTPGHINLIAANTHGVILYGAMSNSAVYMNPVDGSRTLIDNLPSYLDDCGGSVSVEMTGRNVRDLLNAKNVTGDWFAAGFAPSRPAVLNPDGSTNTTAVCGTSMMARQQPKLCEDRRRHLLRFVADENRPCKRAVDVGLSSLTQDLRMSIEDLQDCLRECAGQGRRPAADDAGCHRGAQRALPWQFGLRVADRATSSVRGRMDGELADVFDFIASDRARARTRRDGGNRPGARPEIGLTLKGVGTLAEILRRLDDRDNKGGDSMTLVLRKQRVQDRIERREPLDWAEHDYAVLEETKIGCTGSKCEVT
jgi:hypothetical protein